MTDQQPTPVIATVTGADLLARLDKLSSDIDGIGRKIDDLPRQVHDHESRIRALERRLWMASGAAAVAGTLIGWLLKVAGTIA